MSYYFQTEFHVHNTVYKFLEENEVYDNEDDLDRVVSYANRLYNFGKFNLEEIEAHNMKFLVNEFCLQLKYCVRKSDVEKLMDDYRKYWNSYLDLFRGEISKEDEEVIKQKFSNRKMSWEKVFDKNEDKYKEFNEDVKELAESLIKKYGIYVFKNEEGQVIYVGKSARNLGERVMSSLREKKPYKFCLAEIKNHADVGIYEMYYIAKLKPLLNKDGKTDFEVSFELPALDFTREYITFKGE